MPDSTLSTLAQIKTKVRRLTRSLSVSQLSDSDLNSYINTAVLYDFPEHIRNIYLKTNLSFYTEPFVDTYANNTIDPTNPLYNFINQYISFNPPVYIAGYQALWVQSESQFYGIYPKICSIINVGTGDGSTTTFSGNVNLSFNGFPTTGNNSLILAGQVLFESLTSAGLGISLIDYPVTSPAVSNIVGALGPVGVPIDSLPSPYGQINYITGDFSLNFTEAPAAGAIINAQVFITQPSIPQTILFYDGQFILRPVPDQVYKVEMEAYIRPTELLNNTDQPRLAEWWQYISYLASKKIFEDRMDLESVRMILPELKAQQNLIQRRTIVQLTTQRTPTMYVEQIGSAGAYGSGWFSGGSLF